ncbi:hypothetical protein P4361_03085 [Fictibacillus sp. B-59209]|uniref:hypothetical protein n=1 Tax=Fictibacillus sp. B-59209 TaxID=3024873 RepID=UPI002E20DBFA|nr:hypothetical protein [Fictibacillus sp. B-59209]
MKRKIAGTLMALGIVGATLTLTAGTFSDFKDSSSINNKVETGFMKIEVSKKYPNPLFFTFPADGRPGNWADGYWQPGKISKSKTMVITNTGSVDVLLDGISASIDETNITDNSVKENFTKWLDVKIYNGQPTSPSDTPIYSGTLNDLLSSKQPLLNQNTLLPYNSDLDPNDYETPLYVTIKMSRDADNTIMGKYIKFSLTAHSKQP